jgi:phosphatidylglycerophosphate synthase
MSLSALVVGDSDTRLWGLTSAQRIARQLQQMGGVDCLDDLDQARSASQVLLLGAGYLFELRTLKALQAHPNSLLRCPVDGGLAAALVDGEHVDAAVEALGNASKAVAGLEVIEPAALQAYDSELKRAEPPLLEPISKARQSVLEDQLYGNAYKGITDLVTKWLWPVPARHMVRWCSRAGISPNAVTVFGFALMLAACYLFLQGQYLLGLAAGWFMTYLDTVDGKLARVTVSSSRAGHALDHGMDIIHPPFWYMFWGFSLSGFEPVFGLGLMGWVWVIWLGYLFGRLAEGAFDLLGNAAIFAWRPFDAYFRLFTARRNTCMIPMTAFALLGHPDWAFVAVAVWTAITTLILLVRLIQGIGTRLLHGPVQSWMSEEDVASGPYARAFARFSSTRAAYNRG